MYDTIYYLKTKIQKGFTYAFGTKAPTNKCNRTDWDHPLLAAMRKLDLTTLELLLGVQAIWHVACYVITDAGNIMLQKKPFLFTNKTSVQSFGGCNYPNHIVRMLNSIRLELMDECGLVLSEANLIRASPLIVLAEGLSSTLIQIVLVKDEAMNNCWSAETARSFLGAERVPVDAGGRAEVEEKVRSMGSCVHKVPLADAKAFGNWRKCDLESLGLLERMITDLREGEVTGNELLLLPHPTNGSDKELGEKLEQLKGIFDSPAMAELRQISRLPWYPVLWDDAERVFQVTAEEFMKLP